MTDHESHDAALENALRDAFGRSANDTPAGDGGSILELVRRRVGETSRGHMAESASEEAPVTRPGSRELDRGTDGGRRYDVLEEVARGGIGAVYRGRDVDLGRDVAIKVLLDRYRESEEMIARFLEEAQIEGQLQHPGVVPVHEAGRLGDQRPFFTMKLVEGETLGRLLKQRPDPAADRHRFLGIFEKVLETMAYAHAQGVIHRDLKPSNIMIGAFGEVQVMDWGLAKVLACGEPPADEGAGTSESAASIETVRSGTPGSQSLSGSVMGTPSYMSPEQARGEIEALDRRTDVFSLGAILFEILTGEPPYSGASATEVRELAAQGDADRLRRALAAAAVDDEVRKIVEAMMATDAVARPRDAGEALAAFSDYLAALEARTRAAELRAAEERARSKESRRRVEQERKARRLTVALAVSVVAALLLGGGGFLWVESRSAARLEKTRGTVDRALDEAIRLRGQALAANPVDVSIWSKAVAAARRAGEVADAGEADAATRERVATLLAEFVEAEAAAEEAASARRAREAAAERLYRLRVWGGDPDFAAKVRFALGGLGVDLDKGEPSEIGRRIIATGLGAEVAVVLDLLAEEMRRLREESWQRYARIALECDADPFRKRVREAAHRRDLKRMRALAKEDGTAKLPPANLALLGNALAWSGDIPAAVDLLWAARRVHAGDFWIQRAAGEWLYELGPEKQGQALRCLEAALALNPGSTGVRRWIAFVHRKAGRIDEAASVYEEAMRINPDDVDVLISYGGLLSDEKHDTDGALLVLRRAVAKGPSRPGAHYNLGTVCIRAGLLQDAMASFAKAIEVDPENPYYVNNAGMAHLKEAQRAKASGEEADLALREAIRYFRRAIELRPKFGMYHNNLGAALLERGDWRAAAAALEKAIEFDATHHRYFCNLGDCYEKLGRSKEAIEAYQTAVGLESEFSPSWHRLGQLYFRAKAYAEAAQAFRKAVELDPNGSDSLFWLGDTLLRRNENEQAVEVYERALAKKPGNAAAWSNLGQASARLGRLEASAKAYRKCLAIKPNFRWAHYNLAVSLAGLGDTAGAIAAYEGAVRVDPRDTWALCNLANVLRRVGDLRRARTLLEKAVQLKPRDGAGHSNLGITYYELGRLDDAERSVKRALELAPRDEWAPRYEKKIARARQLEMKLPPILRGETSPGDTKDLLDLAELCAIRRRFAARLRFFEAAFVAEPKLLADHHEHHRYGAACSAILAAGGAGVDAGDLDDAQRRSMRGRALTWLQAEVESCRGLAKTADAKTQVQIRSELAQLALDRKLDAVRGEKALAGLSEIEQEAWKAFWREVHALQETVRWDAETSTTASPEGRDPRR